jgi:hypothetical protein
MSAQAPVGTTLAILERTLKIMSAVQARIHYSMHEEFRLLKGIIRDFTPDEYRLRARLTVRRKAKQSDYDQVDVVPVSDPNAATMSQKVVQYQAILQLAQSAPQIYDLPVLHRQMIEVLGVKNAAKLVPMQDDRKPRDPVTENMDLLRGKPVKAFAYQDHRAHIAVHASAKNDPQVQALVGQNPQMAQQLMAAMDAHINEHAAFEYRNQIEQAIGMEIPSFEEDNEDDQEEISQEMELEISRRAAMASQQILQQHMQEAQQQQNQQQMQDPIIQMQMQELQIKQAEVQRKIAKDKLDAAAKDKQLQVEMERINAQKEIAGANMAMKHTADKSRNDTQMEMEGFRQGMDIQKMRLKPKSPPPKGKSNERDRSSD